MVEIKNKIDQIANHPIPQALFRGAKKTVSEVILVTASARLLEFAAARIAPHPLVSLHTWQVVALAPVIEEILFRGIIQEGVIHTVQRVRNYFVGKVSEKDLKAQEVFRVHVTAILFGAVHATNSHPDRFSKLLQCTWCYIGGSSYGYLNEKYKTLSISILAHGLNNGLAMMAVFSRAYPHGKVIQIACLVGIWGAQVFWFLLSRDYISLPSKDQMVVKSSYVGQRIMSFFSASRSPLVLVNP